MDHKNVIKHLAYKNGFDVVGFARPEYSNKVISDYLHFIDSGRHGEMDWLKERAELRINPKAIMEDVKTIIVLGLNYAPDHNPIDNLAHKDKGLISVYATGKDYHDIIKGRLKNLASQIRSKFSRDKTIDNLKVFVDTAPILEKPLAAQTRVGWQGKHTCIVSRDFGSWLFLGEIFISVDVEPDVPEPNRCGSCRACIDICPTNAITEDGRIDARKCISYLTIEHKGMIPEEFRKAIGNRIYGCDDCLAVCPWNKFAKTASEMAFKPKDGLYLPDIKKLLSLSDAEFRSMFATTPVKRIGRERFIRNVIIAAANSGNKEYINQLNQLSNEDSEIISQTAKWAVDVIKKCGQ